VFLNEKSNKKPIINYPCEWGYKIIGNDKDKLEAVVLEVMGNRSHKQKGGNRSSKGKFYSLSTSCQVESQEDRDRLFKAFQEHQEIKMVI
jgi:putative lipoic acid-binding regulatory protein